MHWANPAALVIWNASNLEELLKRDFAGDLSEATNNRMKDLLLLLREGGSNEDEWTVYPNGGPGKTFSITSTGIRIEGGRIAALVEGEMPDKGNFQKDSTLAVETLRHIPLPCSRFELDGTIQYQTPESIQVFGSITNADQKASNFVQRFLDRSVGASVLRKAQAGENLGVTEAELYTLKGPRWFAVQAQRVRNPVSKRADQEYMIIDTAQDMTDIKQAQKDSNRARIKNDFLAQISHSLRTPLHQVVGHMDLLEGNQQLNKQQLDTIHIVQGSVNLMMAIISDMLDFSKLESGMMELDHVPFVLKSVVDCSVSALRQDIEEKNLIFDVNILNQTQLPTVLMGDSNRLQQILVNFLENAVRFTERGSVSLTVAVVDVENGSEGIDILSESQHKLPPLKPDESSIPKKVSTPPPPKHLLRFEVKDTGIGMDPSHKLSVFQKYQQAHSGIRATYGGVGLGLAICKDLVRLMDGRLGVESELDKGTLVWFEVPLHVPPPATGMKSPCTNAEELSQNLPIKQVTTLPYTAASLAEGTAVIPLLNEVRRFHVLVAEDNKINQKMVRSMLQRMGHKVTVTENGQLCVDELDKYSDEQPIDCVLMDVQMPVMDGIEATRKIREHYTKSKLPVIGLTASYRHEDLEDYLGIGMNHCIGKPVKLNTLKRTIESVMAAATLEGDEGQGHADDGPSVLPVDRKSVV